MMPMGKIGFRRLIADEGGTGTTCFVDLQPEYPAAPEERRATK